MSRPVYPVYNGPQAPTLNRYYHPCSITPPDAEQLARRQQREDKKRQMLYERLTTKKTDPGNSSSSRQKHARGLRPPSTNSADTVSEVKSISTYDSERAWWASKETCRACDPDPCTHEEHADAAYGNCLDGWAHSGSPPPGMDRPPRPRKRPRVRGFLARFSHSLAQ